jgi:2',3'-cyclic-nucleotide 2'-phosphodiesterase (5'-nucleotidase family)
MRDMRERVLPILEAAGVDLIIGGHSHDYQRSHLVNNYYGKTLDWNPEVSIKLQFEASGTET